MKKYIFSDRVDKKVTKYEIVAETLVEAQALLSAKLETIRGISIVGVGLPDYIEPIDPPTDLTLKTFNITYRDDRGLDETITYKALSLDSATGRFLEDFPDQAGKSREIHMPLGNYAIDRENAKKKDYLGNIFHDPEVGFFEKLFGQTISWIKLITVLFISLIAFDFVVSALFGVDGGFGVVTNLTILLGNSNSLSALIVLFLVYYLFIRSDEKEKT